MTRGSRTNAHRDGVLHLTLPLAVASALAGLLTILAPGLLSGPPVMNGSARGTALVVVLVAVPSLVAGVAGARRGSVLGLAVATGATAYLVYNAVLFVFATPFNRGFLVYEAMLGLAIVSLAALGLQLWHRVSSLAAAPPRWVGVFLWSVVGLNLLVWMSAIVPALFDERPRSMLDGTGLTTNPVYAQDLAFWLPAIAWLALGVWRRHPPRVALASAALWFWLVEALGVAADQWWGHHAARSSSAASGVAAPVFICLAVVTVWPLLRLLRCLPRSDEPVAAVGVEAQTEAAGAQEQAVAGFTSGQPHPGYG